MQKITPFLWYDSEAEEAAKFYVSIFKNSKIDKITRYPEDPPSHEATARQGAAQKIGRTPGSVMTVEFTLDGVQFVGLNGGPQFKFNESVSFVVNCETQDEVDYFWEKLSADGGEKSRCSWLKDKYGLSWQVQPRLLIELLGDPDPAVAGRVMNAMMEMDKIDISALRKAASG